MSIQIAEMNTIQGAVKALSEVTLTDLKSLTKDQKKQIKHSLGQIDRTKETNINNNVLDHLQLIFLSTDRNPKPQKLEMHQNAVKMLSDPLVVAKIDPGKKEDENTSKMIAMWSNAAQMADHSRNENKKERAEAYRKTSIQLEIAVLQRLEALPVNEKLDAYSMMSKKAGLSEQGSQSYMEKMVPKYMKAYLDVAEAINKQTVDGSSEADLALQKAQTMDLMLNQLEKHRQDMMGYQSTQLAEIQKSETRKEVVAAIAETANYHKYAEAAMKTVTGIAQAMIAMKEKVAKIKNINITGTLEAYESLDKRLNSIITNRYSEFQTLKPAEGKKRENEAREKKNELLAEANELKKKELSLKAQNQANRGASALDGNASLGTRGNAPRGKEVNPLAPRNPLYRRLDAEPKSSRGFTHTPTDNSQGSVKAMEIHRERIRRMQKAKSKRN